MKKLIIYTVYLLILLVLGGCSMKKTIKYEIKFYDSSIQNAFFHTDKSYNDTGMCRITSKIVKTREELILLCDENNSPAFFENSEKYNNEINQLIRSFTEEYFQSKALVICFGTGNVVWTSGKIKNISKDDDILVINYSQKDPEQSLAVIVHKPWILIIEVNQKDIEGINGCILTKESGIL